MIDPWIEKIPWRRAWQLAPVFLPGGSHGQRRLAGYSPWGCKESDTTEQLTLHFHFMIGSWNPIVTINLWSMSIHQKLLITIAIAILPKRHLEDSFTNISAVTPLGLILCPWHRSETAQCSLPKPPSFHSWSSRGGLGRILAYDIVGTRRHHVMEELLFSCLKMWYLS